ncbi:Ammonium transporter [hydrothermal vent metagenome]|uniref:Ammonium transporter n=1 Tax=hydrothermal vent metagenome TaxID=652676 RepID=A0A3B0YX33_9ZZZZ
MIKRKVKLLSFAGIGLFISLFTSTALSATETPPSIITAHLAVDTVWIVVAGALVFFMQAGFALLEGGMVRSKNTVNVVMKNYTDMCFGALAFWLIGYGFLFGTNTTGFIGTDHFMAGNNGEFDYSRMFFHIMVAATAATIVSGAMAERARFQAYLVAVVVITAFIYPIFGSWVWGSLDPKQGMGWLRSIGFIDFAGASVVHSLGGWCALAGVIVLGPRLGKYDPEGKPRYIAGHNLPMVALGGFILWLGWFGFNGGMTAALASNTDNFKYLGLIVLNTHLAAAAGAVGAVLGMSFKKRPILMTNTIYGSLGGLVSVTAGCHVMSPGFAIITGIIAGTIVIYGMDIMDSRGWDDPVGAVSVHGLCGAWGTLAVGIFDKNNLFDISQVFIQLLGIIVCFIWSFGVAYAVFKLIDRYMGLRASTIAQQRGLDFAEHYEVGYPEFQKDALHQGKNSRQ